MILVAFYIKNNVVIDPLSMLVPGGLLVMAANNYLNLFIMSNYFPDKVVPDQLRKTKTVLFIASIFFYALLVLFIIIGSIQEFRSSKANSSAEGKLLLAGLVLIFVQWTYVLFAQVRMVRIIKQEHSRTINATINSIGQE
jgi:hypothetical protein